jgi:hypothetical protein
MKPWRGLLAAAACGGAAWIALSCAPSGFASESTIATVRILASSATEPYAKPGDTVTVQVLAYDGRPQKPAPMVVSWLPFRCVNPEDDAYYACFEQLAGGDAGSAGTGVVVDAGADAGAGAGFTLVTGEDLTPFLVTGTSMTVQIPSDVVATHAPVSGSAPYGLVILFNFACAGHLQYVPPTGANPQQVPIGCFDSQGNALGPDDFVFGFTRIYASGTVTDTNPVITQVDAPGGPLPVSFGATSALALGTCTNSNTAKCTQNTIGPIIQPPMADREVWADFYSTAGSFTSDARLLYGATTGSVGPPSATDTQYQAPADAGAQLIWIVVHDDHNGASWVTVPVSVH